MAEKKLKVTLIKSTIGAVPKNKKTIEALGLSKLYKTVELPDNAATASRNAPAAYRHKAATSVRKVRRSDVRPAGAPARRTPRA